MLCSFLTRSRGKYSLVFPTSRILRCLLTGKRLTTAWQDRIDVWDLERSQRLLTLPGHVGGAVAMAFSPDGRLIASGGRDRFARIWSAETGEQLFLLSGHRDHVTSLAFTGDGRSLVTAGPDKFTKLWHVATGQFLWDFDYSANGYSTNHALAFSSDGGRLFFCLGNGLIRMLDIFAVSPNDPGTGDGARTDSPN